MTAYLPRSEFFFSYRQGATECRVVIRAQATQAVSSFMVCEPGAAANDAFGIHLAISHTLPLVGEDDNADSWADTLIAQLYSQDTVVHMAPAREDLVHLRRALVDWLTRGVDSPGIINPISR